MSYEDDEAAELNYAEAVGFVIFPAAHEAADIVVNMQSAPPFEVSWNAGSYGQERTKPRAFLQIDFPRYLVSEPNAAFYCTERALWKLRWFLRDFGYDQDLPAQEQVDEKALINLRGVLRTTHVTQNGRSFQNLDMQSSAHMRR